MQDGVHERQRTMRLIHYGTSAFIPELFTPIQNRNWHKPRGGLWSSPVDSDHSWKDWCDSESFGTLDDSFEFEYDGETFVIDSSFDLLSMPRLAQVDGYAMFSPDFEKMLSDGIDAIHLTAKGEPLTRFSEPSLYGWDCETVLIMNPDCVMAL